MPGALTSILGALLGGDLLGLRRGLLGDVPDDGVYILHVHQGRIWISRGW